VSHFSLMLLGSELNISVSDVMSSLGANCIRFIKYCCPGDHVKLMIDCLFLSSSEFSSRDCRNT